MSISTWVTLISQLISIAAMILWNVKKEEWAKADSDRAKQKDQAATIEQNQSAQQLLDDAEAQNNADREKILKG